MGNDPSTNDWPDADTDLAKSLEEETASRLGQEQVKTPGQVRILRAESEYLGPLPHPEHWAKYEAVLPGAADRILTEVEKEGEHRRQETEHRRRIEEHFVYSNTKLAERGQLISLGLAVLSLVGGGLLIYFGRPWGVILILASTTGLVSAFLRVISEKRREQEDVSKDIIPAPPPSRRNRI